MSSTQEGPSGHDTQSPIQIQAKSDSNTLHLKRVRLEFKAPVRNISVKFQSEDHVLRKGFEVRNKTDSPYEWTVGGYASIAVGSDLQIFVKEKHWLKRHAKELLTVPQVTLTNIFSEMTGDRDEEQTFKIESFAPAMKYIESLTVVFGPSTEIQDALHQKLTYANDALESTRSVLERMGPTRKFLGLVSAFSDSIGDLHPAAKAAMVVFEKLYKKLEEQESSKALAVNLVNRMLDMLSFMDNVEDAMMKLRVTKDTVMEMFQLLEKVADFAVVLIETNNLQGLFTSLTKDIPGFEAQFADLKEKYDRCFVQEILSAVEQQGVTNALSLIKPVVASYSPEDGCLPGTRKGILATITEWASLGTTNVFWVHGAAGTGKSTVTTSVALTLKSH